MKNITIDGEKYRKKNDWLVFTLILATIVAIIFGLKQQNNTFRQKIENANLIASLYDTIHYWKSSDSTKTATISVIQTESDNAFTNLMISNDEIIKLQDIVKTYQGRLKPGSSVTHATIETKVDTSVKHSKIDVVGNSGKITPIDSINTNEVKWWPMYTDSFKDKWIAWNSIATPDSTHISLKVNNEFSAVVGVDKKTKKPFVDLITENPYSSVKTLRTYQVKVPKQKRFSLSISTGMNFLPSFENDLLKPALKVQPYLGAGISYRLINLF